MVENRYVTSNKEVILKHSDEILSYPNSVKTTIIAKELIEKYGYASLIPDSLRRSIAKFIDSNNKISNLVDDFTNYLDGNVGQPQAPSREDFDDVEDEKEMKTSLKDNYEFDENFSYDEAKDVYFFYFSTKPLRFTGTIIREMKSKYSNMISPSLTINEIAREFKIPRAYVLKIKTILGWTHDSDPYTNEELLVNNVDDMVDDLLQRKKFELYQKYNREDDKLTKEAAQKWYNFTSNTVNPLLEKMGEIRADYVVPRLKLEDTEEEVVCVISPFDLHYGKYAWDGDTNDNYNRSIAKERLLDKTAQLLNNVVKFNVVKFIVAVGSDFFHIDNFENSTTRGTKQDVDGTVTQIMAEGNLLMVEFIDILRQIAPVELLMAAGNHDNILSVTLQLYLSAYYRDTPDVFLHNKLTDRQYTKYGDTLIGFTHGDGPKLDKLPGLMASEESKLWGETKHRVFFVGHLHSEVIKDVNGVKIYQMPSLSGTDKWHHKQGYVNSVKGMSAYIIDKTSGVTASLIANV